MGNPLSSLSLLHEPDEIIEIRSIDPNPVISGYFRALPLPKRSPVTHSVPSTRQ